MKIFKKSLKDFSTAKNIQKIQKQDKSKVKGGIGDDDVDGI